MINWWGCEYKATLHFFVQGKLTLAVQYNWNSHQIILWSYQGFIRKSHMIVRCCTFKSANKVNSTFHNSTEFHKPLLNLLKSSIGLSHQVSTWPITSLFLLLLQMFACCMTSYELMQVLHKGYEKSVRAKQAYGILLNNPCWPPPPQTNHLWANQPPKNHFRLSFKGQSASEAQVMRNEVRSLQQSEDVSWRCTL